MSDDFSFGLDQITTILDQEKKSAEAANAAALGAARANTAVRNKVRESAAVYQAEAKRTQGELDQIEADREEVLGLADSQNPMDMLNLIGGQILSPQKYTRAGRQARAAEASQLLALQGQIHGVNVAGAEAQIALNNARAVGAAARQEAGLNNLRTRVQVLNLAAQNNASVQALRTNTLDTMSLGDLQQSLTGADENGIIKVGDFEFETWEIQEREKAMQSRKLLAQIPLTDAPPESLLAWQTLHLDTMTHSQLLELQADGYEKDGITFQRGLVDQQLATSAAREAQQAADSLNRISIDQNLVRAYTGAEDLIDSLTGKFDPASGIGQALEQYRITVDQIAGAAGSEEMMTPEGKQLQLAALRQQQANLQAAVEAEAKVQAAGDKELMPIMRDRMLGMPVDPVRVRDYASARFSKGQSFSQAMDPSQAAKLNKAASEEYARIMAENQRDVYSAPMSAEEKKILKQQAFDSAWDAMIEDTAYAAVGTTTKAGIMMDGNPFKDAGFGLNDMEQLNRESKRAAMLAIATERGLSEEDVNHAINGREQEAGMSANEAELIREQYNSQMVYAQFQGMERLQPGLGGRYAEWYRNNATSVGAQVNRVQNRTDANLYQAGIDNLMQDAVQLWQVADIEGQRHAMLQANRQLLDMRNPTIIWQSVLGTMKNMPDSTKARMWFDVIEPVIIQAALQQTPSTAVMDLITQRLNNGIENNPELTSAARQLVKAMPEIVGTLETHYEAMDERIKQRFNPRLSYTLEEIRGKDVPYGSLQWLGQESEQRRLLRDRQPLN